MARPHNGDSQSEGDGSVAARNGSTPASDPDGSSLKPFSSLPMTLITIKLTIKELELLTSLAADQLFRREFIDPKMPGARFNSGEISQGKVLLNRMRNLLDPSAARRTPPARIAN